MQMLVQCVGERGAVVAETGAIENGDVGAVAVSAVHQTCQVGQLGCWVLAQ